MAKLKTYTPSSEAELHGVIRSELEAVEEGLILLQHEYPSGKGIVDLLCVDSGGRLVIIEIKLHEDENVLFQALRYFSDVDQDRYKISNLFTNQEIDPNESPRVVLIAERFSEDIRRLSTLVVPEVELLEYTTVKLPDGQAGIVFHSVSLPQAARPPSEPKSVDQLIDYLRNSRLKPVIHEMREVIKSIGEGIEEYATQGYLGYRHESGRQFAFIRVYRQELGFGAIVIDEDRQILDYDETRIQSKADDYSDALMKVKTSYVNLGGILHDDAS